MKRMQEEKDFKQIQEEVSNLNEKHLYKHHIVLNFDDSIYLKINFSSTSNTQIDSRAAITKLIAGDASYSYEDGDIIRFNLYIKPTDNEIVFVGSSTETYEYSDAVIMSYDIDTIL